MHANSGTGTVYLSRALVFDKVSIVHFVFKLEANEANASLLKRQV
jgi:hypothetical protein